VVVQLAQRLGVGPADLVGEPVVVRLELRPLQVVVQLLRDTPSRDHRDDEAVIAVQCHRDSPLGSRGAPRRVPGMVVGSWCLGHEPANRLAASTNPWASRFALHWRAKAAMFRARVLSVISVSPLQRTASWWMPRLSWV